MKAGDKIKNIVNKFKNIRRKKQVFYKYYIILLNIVLYACSPGIHDPTVVPEVQCQSLKVVFMDTVGMIGN